MEQNWITSDDILGKDVIDTNGTFLGVVDKLFLTPDTVSVQGISIDKGFLEKGLVVSRKYIERVSKYAVFLNITPLFLLLQKKVYTGTGHYIGIVVDVTQDEGKSNALESLVVKTKTSKREIHSSEIEQVGKSIVLK